MLAILILSLWEFQVWYSLFFSCDWCCGSSLRVNPAALGCKLAGYPGADRSGLRAPVRRDPVWRVVLSGFLWDVGSTEKKTKIFKFALFKTENLQPVQFLRLNIVKSFFYLKFSPSIQIFKSKHFSKSHFISSSHWVLNYVTNKIFRWY